MKIKNLAGLIVILGGLGVAPIIPAGNGEISYARFEDHATHETIYQQIPDNVYTLMGTEGGARYNPVVTSTDGVVVPMINAIQYLTQDSIVEVVETPVATSTEARAPPVDSETLARQSFTDNDNVSLFQYLTPKVGAAIAFDAVSHVGHNTGTSQTWAHTITGSNTILFTYCWVNGASDVFTSLKYNAVSMSSISSVASYNGASNHGYLYYLVAPTTGANNIVLTLSSSVDSACAATSYTGAAQSGVPDATFTDAGDGSSNNFAMTVTTVADNAWLVGGNNDLDAFCSAGANTTVRDANNPIISDSNGARTPPGSQSLNLASCGNRVEDKLMASFAPFIASVIRVLDGRLIMEDQ